MLLDRGVFDLLGEISRENAEREEVPVLSLRRVVHHSLQLVEVERIWVKLVTALGAFVCPGCWLFRGARSCQ